ncbi:PREDICTED: atherin-like, partial [Chinchilla lanigera]|uniref:atherin-like n=1 Tax=Chinchilla lanigera TaxID=34839 RepID=UPI0006979474
MRGNWGRAGRPRARGRASPEVSTRPNGRKQPGPRGGVGGGEPGHAPARPCALIGPAGRAPPGWTVRAPVLGRAPGAQPPEAGAEAEAGRRQPALASPPASAGTFARTPRSDRGRMPSVGCAQPLGSPSRPPAPTCVRRRQRRLRPS